MMCLISDLRKQLRIEDGHSLAETVTAVSLLNLIILIAVQALIYHTSSDMHECVFRALQKSLVEIHKAIKKNEFNADETFLVNDYILRTETDEQDGYRYIQWYIENSRSGYRALTFRFLAKPDETYGVP